MIKILTLIGLLGLAAMLAACASNISELAKDQSTACINQTVIAPGWSESITVVRSNAASDSSASGSPCAVNHGGSQPAAATTLAPAAPAKVQ